MQWLGEKWGLPKPTLTRKACQLVDCCANQLQALGTSANGFQYTAQSSDQKMKDHVEGLDVVSRLMEVALCISRSRLIEELFQIAFLSKTRVRRMGKVFSSRVLAQMARSLIGSKLSIALFVIMQLDPSPHLCIVMGTMTYRHGLGITHCPRAVSKTPR